MAHELWENHFCSARGLLARSRVSPMCRKIPGRLQDQIFYAPCWDQFLCLAFAQLTCRESLRDIQACLRGSQQKLYHLGFRGNVSRNPLAHANQVRDWRIYGDFAHILIAQARRIYAPEDFGVEREEAVSAFDASTIDLCLSVFPWAKFRQRKAAIKLPILMDLRGSIPTLSFSSRPAEVTRSISPASSSSNLAPWTFSTGAVGTWHASPTSPSLRLSLSSTPNATSAFVAYFPSKRTRPKEFKPIQ